MFCAPFKQVASSSAEGQDRGRSDGKSPSSFSGQPPSRYGLTIRATASRPRWGSAKSEKSRCGRSRCAGAFGCIERVIRKVPISVAQPRQRVSQTF
jgi:hypothetical protein